MNRVRQALLCASLSVFTSLSLCGLQAGAVESTTAAAVDKTAPDFSLPDTNGKTHTLSGHQGKYVVLEWTNFDCPFVRKQYESGGMQKLQKNYMAKGVTWFTICSSAPGRQGNYPPEKINQLVKQYGNSPTAYLLDPDGKVGRAYGAKATPHMYVINPKGNLIYMGAIDDNPSTDISDTKVTTNYVQKALEESMTGKPVSTTTTQAYGCSIKYQK